MILAKFIPRDSQKYQSINKEISVYSDLIEKYNILHLFAIWTMTVSGFTFMQGQLDRYSYWDWSGCFEGMIRLTIATILFYWASTNGLWTASNDRIRYIEILRNIVFCSIYFLIGAVNISFEKINILGVLPYISAFAAGILIFEFKIKYDQTKKDWEVDSWDNKTYYFSISLLLLITSTAMGKLLDDPIISTVSMVSLFFPAVTLIWPNHVRHIKRVQFYPLFILSMFTCVRAPWFLILLGLLFFTIRSVNYLKYAIIYPSFGVAQEETIVDV